MCSMPECGEKASVDTDKCIGCGKCLEVCWFDAMEGTDGAYTVDEADCQGCYSCRVICPIDGCISMRMVV